MSLMHNISMIVVAVVLIAALFPVITSTYEEGNITYVDSESEWEAWYEEYYLSSDYEYTTAYEYARYAEYSSDYYSGYSVYFYSSASNILTSAYDSDSGYVGSSYDLATAASLSAPLAVISNVFCASLDLESGEYRVWYINTSEDEFDSTYQFYLEYLIYGEFVPDDGAYIYIEPYIGIDGTTYHLYYNSTNLDEDGEEERVYDLGELEYLLVPCSEGDLVMPVYDIGGVVDSGFDFSTYIGLGAEWHQSNYSYIYAFNTYYNESAYATYSVVAIIGTSTMSGNATGYLHYEAMFNVPTVYALESGNLDVLSVSVSLSETYEAYEYVASFTLTEDESEDSEIVADFANISGLYVIVPMDYAATEESNSAFGNVVSAVMLMIVILVVSAAVLMLVRKDKRS